MFSLENVNAFYGKAHILKDISLRLGENEIVSLIGRNGAGKSTTLKTLMGLIACTSGKKILNGQDVTLNRPDVLSRLGVAYVPEDRQIFPNLSVEENLKIAGVAHKKGKWTLKMVYELFPRLQERAKSRGDTLSGGEQQMLALARGVLTDSKVLLLDEPTEGLAPLIVKDLVKVIRVINQEGVSILLVEENLNVPIALAHRHYVIDNGTIKWEGTTKELNEQRETVEGLISL